MTKPTKKLEASEPVGSRRESAAWASPTQGGIAEARCNSGPPHSTPDCVRGGFIDSSRLARCGPAFGDEV